MNKKNSNIKIGWAQTEITPQEKVFVTGQFPARVSEGVENPLTTTVLVIESSKDYSIFVSMDVVCISNSLYERIRKQVQNRVKDLDPAKLVINATHTHTGPQVRIPGIAKAGVGSVGAGVDLDVMDVSKCVDFIAGKVAKAVQEAWGNRAPGGIAYGLGSAVIGTNRRWVNDQGESTMYGLNGNKEFRYMEGYEDHSLNLLSTYDSKDNLTGVVVNVPCPSQVTEHLFILSADYWHETRGELRQRLGENLFVLGQCSAAGDQAPRPMYEKQAAERMLQLKNRTQRQELAQRIADGVTDILPAIQSDIKRNLNIQHDVQTLDLPMTRLSKEDADNSQAEAEKCRAVYEQEKQKLEDDPELKKQNRWYLKVSQAFRRMMWHQGVVDRYQRQEAGETTLPTEIHVLQIGEIALATIPFEYYLDFGIQIKVRSKALQTFLVQLVGDGTYLPSPRSVAGGGYGSVPASCQVGPEAGQVLAEHIVKKINQTDCNNPN